jgi:hypothetical protein
MLTVRGALKVEARAEENVRPLAFTETVMALVSRAFLLYFDDAFRIGTYHGDENFICATCRDLCRTYVPYTRPGMGSDELQGEDALMWTKLDPEVAFAAMMDQKVG